MAVGCSSSLFGGFTPEQMFASCPHGPAVLSSQVLSGVSARSCQSPKLALDGHGPTFNIAWYILDLEVPKVFLSVENDTSANVKPYPPPPFFGS